MPLKIHKQRTLVYLQKTKTLIQYMSSNSYAITNRTHNIQHTNCPDFSSRFLIFKVENVYSTTLWIPLIHPKLIMKLLFSLHFSPQRRTLRLTLFTRSERARGAHTRWHDVWSRLHVNRWQRSPTLQTVNSHRLLFDESFVICMRSCHGKYNCEKNN